MPYLYESEHQGAPKSGLLLLQALVLLVFFIFSLRFWYLQVHKGEEFSKLARENQLRRELIYAPRGTIRDRNGAILALNQPGYALTLVREDCLDVQATLEQISRWTGINYATLEKRFQQLRRQVKPFERMTLVSDISFDLVSRIEANTVYWPGLEISIRPTRMYPHGPVVSNILGYLLEADKEDLQQNDELRPGDMVGKQGVEKILEDTLRGDKGLRQLQVDATGRHLHSEVLTQPKAGEDVSLSIDLDLQRHILEQFEGKAGAAVVLEPDSGQVLALVTSPTYDTNIFTSENLGQKWSALRKHPRQPLLNRAIQSTYPPGSVWKLLVSANALHDGFITPSRTFFCSGAYKLGRMTFRCWKKTGHGTVDLQKGLVQSCDVYYYQVGEKLGVDRMSAYAFASGFGKPTGIALPNESSGLVPTREWKRRRFDEPWQGGENLNMSIGQGFTLVTPIQVARYIAALLNGGRILQPNLLHSSVPIVQGELPLAESYRQRILDAMVETVEHGRGTARSIQRADVQLGAKTGTAQVVSIGKVRKKTYEMPYEHRDHAWLATWGRSEGTEYVVVALVEHGGHGGSAAGPLVKSIFDYLFGPEPQLEGEQPVAGGTNVVPPASLPEEQEDVYIPPAPMGEDPNQPGGAEPEIRFGIQ